jgi:hypothetical protein
MYLYYASLNKTQGSVELRIAKVAFLPIGGFPRQRLRTSGTRPTPSSHLICRLSESLRSPMAKSRRGETTGTGPQLNPC